MIECRDEKVILGHSNYLSLLWSDVRRIRPGCGVNSMIRAKCKALAAG